MSEELIKNADECYRLVEQRASHYFKSLNVLVSQKTYVSTLTKDIQSWKHNHIRHHSLFSLFSGGKGKPSPEDYHNYIQWLDRTGKLDHYLDRSISYIFMRDLGKALDSKETQTSIRRVVDSLKNQLIHSNETEQVDQTEMFNMAGLYRKAQSEGIESTMIWLVNKLKTISSNIPRGLDAEQAQRKLIKITAGVLMHEVIEMDDGVTADVRAQKLDEAIRLGYSYGLTYPFIDDLLDAKVLSAEEKKQYSDLIRTTLITGTVPELGEWAGNNAVLIRFIHSELRDAFEYIKAKQRPGTIKNFLSNRMCFLIPRKWTAKRIYPIQITPMRSFISQSS